MLRGNCQACNRVDQSENEMTPSQIADVDHGLSQTRLHNAIPHTDNEKKEEGERIAPGVQDCN